MRALSWLVFFAIGVVTYRAFRVSLEADGMTEAWHLFRVALVLLVVLGVVEVARTVRGRS